MWKRGLSPFSHFVADAVTAIGVAYDYVAFCFSGTYGVDELAFNSGNVGVEYDFGFAA